MSCWDDQLGLVVAEMKLRKEKERGVKPEPVNAFAPGNFFVTLAAIQKLAKLLNVSVYGNYTVRGSNGAMYKNLAKTYLKGLREHYKVAKIRDRQAYAKTRSSTVVLRHQLRLVEWAYEFLMFKVTPEELARRMGTKEWVAFNANSYKSKLVRTINFLWGTM